MRTTPMRHLRALSLKLAATVKCPDLDQSEKGSRTIDSKMHPSDSKNMLKEGVALLEA